MLCYKDMTFCTEKDCGNSVCVNVMRWFGMRIELAEREGTLC